ncbi:MAG: CNNM domain-containing protein, partial [Actinomycetota bacterium]|nr:CNNM domain-containing protein [Actinomycetota bacterium]
MRRPGLVAVAQPLLSSFNLLIALALVALNGFFVAAEFALVRVRESRIVQLEQEGSARAGSVRAALRDLDAYLSVCQVGITMASLALGWVGEPAVSHLIEPVLASLGIGSERVVTVVSVIIGFTVITYAHLVFGEQAPKYFSIQRAERTALWISRPLRICKIFLRPVVWIVNTSTNFILR